MKKIKIGFGALLVLVVIFCTACGDKSRAIKANETISVYLHESGEIAEMPLEEYLYGVVAGEMDVNWPKEALAAQAILARTFTLEKMERGGVKEHNTDASTDIAEFQAYNAEKINDRVKAAVDETAGEVVTYKGKLIKAWFFADAGGLTASSAEEGLSYNKTETPYIQSVDDPGANLEDNENRHWEVRFSLEEVGAAFESIGIDKPQKLSTAEIAEYGASGRAVSLKINEAKVPAVAFRLAIGSEKMKSTMIEDIAIKDGELYIAGRGYGHGVGMSQWGAKALAEQGRDAEEIIEYFFRDIEIENIYED